MLIKCSSCKGAKKVNGLGYIETDCKRCNGSGFERKEDPLLPTSENISAEESSKRKKKREEHAN